MNTTLSLIKDIKDRQTLYQAKLQIFNIANIENKNILMKALKNRMYEIEHEVVLQ